MRGAQVHLMLGPIMGLIAGLRILIILRLPGRIVAIYLALIDLLGLFAAPMGGPVGP